MTVNRTGLIMINASTPIKAIIKSIENFFTDFSLNSIMGCGELDI